MNISILRALFTKEIHHLLPLIIAMLLLNVLGLLDSFLTSSPDELTWADLSFLLDTDLAATAGVFYFLLGVVAAYMVLSQEGKQQTLQFLWSLPAKRWHIFAIKLATALVVLTGLILLGHIILLWVTSFSVGSVTSDQFTWSLWWREIMLLLGVTTIGLGYGALVASFRVVGIIVFCSVWAGTVALALMDSSLLFLNFLTLLDLEYRGTEILLTKKTWALHSGVAVLCLAVAAAWWTRDGRAPALRSTATVIRARIGMGFSVLAVLLLILGYGVNQLAPDLLNDEFESDDFELLTFETEHYEFAYFAMDIGQAFVLIDGADDVARDIMTLLNYAHEDRMLADLTDASDTDHLGRASWQKMRIKRSALYEDKWRDHVFVHESTHVLAAAASDRRIADHRAYTAFFSEGLAEWVTFEMLGLFEERRALHLLAALAWQRHDLRFEDIVYSSAFRTRFDQGLVYALGEAWVSTLAEVCGADAPGDVLKAMTRPNAPQRLQGSAFWRDTLQAAGCDLGTVNSRFTALMESYEDDNADVPELVSAVERNGNRLAVSLTLGAADTDEPYRVSVLVRDSASASPLSVISESRDLMPGETVTIDLPLRMVSGERFQYQVGLEFLPGERPFFSRWIDEG